MNRFKNFFNSASIIALIFSLAGLLLVFYLNHTARQILVSQLEHNAEQTVYHRIYQWQHSTLPADAYKGLQTFGSNGQNCYLVAADSIDDAMRTRFPWLNAARPLTEQALNSGVRMFTDKRHNRIFALFHTAVAQNGKTGPFLLAYSFDRQMAQLNQYLRKQLFLSLFFVFVFSLLLGVSLYYLFVRKATRLLTLVQDPQNTAPSSGLFNEMDRLGDFFNTYRQQISSQIEAFNITTENLRKINRHLESELRAGEKKSEVLQKKLAREIQIRKTSESELNKLQRIIEYSPVSIIITNTMGQIEYVNPRFTEVTGYTFEECIGQNPRILKSGNTPKERYKKLWETISSGNTWQGEFHNKKKNRELYWEYAYISPVKNNKGEITHYFAIKEDVTEQKKLNEFLTMYGQALTNIVETVTITDMEDRLIYVNKAFTHLYGYSKKEVLGQHISILLPKDEYPGIPEDLQRQSHQSSWYGELKNIDKDGRKFDILLSTSLIYNELNQPIGIIGVSRDITNEKKDRELERKTEALKTIQELAGAVSHEFSQPLQALNNYLSLMEMVPEPQKYIKKSRASLQRIGELVNNLRDITSIQRQDYLNTQILNLKASSKKQQKQKSNRILIVDDEEAIQETLVELLGMAGYHCDGASDGLAALNYLRNSNYSLILSDINMPKMSGSALFDKLQSIGYSGRFIFMTGYAYTKENEEYLGKGDGILHKPIDALRLLDIVQKSIGAP